MKYGCDQKKAAHKSGDSKNMAELPLGRVIWAAAYPNIAPRATIDHLNSNIRYEIPTLLCFTAPVADLHNSTVQYHFNLYRAVRDSTVQFNLYRAV